MAKTVIGVDIGGTKMSGVVLSGKSVVRELQVPTPKNKKDFTQSLMRLIELLSSGKNIGAIGLGIAGVVDDKKGMVKISPNMKFLDRTNIRKMLEGKAGKIVLDNDSNCFALAESVLGKGKQFANFVGITLGTGIGGGIILKHELFRGSHGSAGEVGHMMADLKNDSEYYFQKARDKKDYEKMGKVLGVLFANIMNVLDVEALVIGGSVGIARHKQFLPEALRVAKLHLVNKGEMPKIVISGLKNAGALGAALLVANV